MPERVSTAATLVEELVGDNAARWDAAGEIPGGVLREMGERGLLCAQVPAAYGGLGLTSAQNGELTAHVGSLDSSLRSIMTSVGMAAWTVQRLGDRPQHRELLTGLAAGRLAAVGFSEPDAGSDLNAIATRLRRDGDQVVLNGRKVWMTAACYADLLIVVARDGDCAAAVAVPADTPGVVVERVPDPLGCRAAGHANVRFDDVRLPASAVLGGGGQPLPLVVTTALAYGRMSVAWGSTGIIRSCLRAAVGHARDRVQGGGPLAGHQLVARHLADLKVAESVSTSSCAHASACWDARSPEVTTATVMAKYVASGLAASSAASAVQVLASAGAGNSHVVARAYRDAKLMEIIEGSSEICQLLIAEHAVASSV
ncbi:acyl-CoA dehydrogenase family protein [Actinoplanes sp. DH11]|uniref:acyl-CoA dehydrogenase family protein n=1 Tax=Actinoplanes sp. DH11 TaxID=2857011 RepID=UPI001E562C1F|nr:acyl-CoA dehydrogenase family protein [Actinoplanes sp. DH11]